MVPSILSMNKVPSLKEHFITRPQPFPVTCWYPAVTSDSALEGPGLNQSLCNLTALCSAPRIGSRVNDLFFVHRMNKTHSFIWKPYIQIIQNSNIEEHVLLCTKKLNILMSYTKMTAKYLLCTSYFPYYSSRTVM